ncbi:MAG: glycosyltransferase family 2 protein [Deltaproteobacteria bacterium]|nr:glycosyltransferase family 2 protein [Deltaproteobacteria bacterium]
MKQVSVIIPTFNRALKVARAVSSVIKQTYKDFEITVVDDGSTDNTSQCLAPFMGQIRYISHPNNKGVSAARNTGIRASRSPLIAFLDSDDYWLPEKLGLQADYMKNNPHVQVCQTDEIWIRKGFRVNPRKKHKKPSGNIFEPSLKLCLISPSAVMMRSSLFEEVGLFDEDFPVCEDYDLWLRISCNHEIHLIAKKLVVKEGGCHDQLSLSLKGIDRFRIKAMIKLLKSGKLSNVQTRSLLKELGVKCRIYGKGCLKRGKGEEGKYYLGLPEAMEKEFSNCQDCYGHKNCDMLIGHVFFGDNFSD